MKQNQLNEKREKCKNCSENASVTSYGGESGEYCWEHYIEMLQRINS